jgi:alcohol sulfotransferase
VIRQSLRATRQALIRARLAAAAGGATAFLASYPKSGRTWLRFILANYLNETAGLGVSVDLHTMFAVVPNFDYDPVRGLPAFHFKGRAQMPLVPVTHYPYSRFLFRGRPIVFMIRDPRDVMVSSYFHATRHKHRFKGDIAGFLRDQGLGLPHLIRYLNGWADGIAQHRHLVLSYERLSADPEAATAEVLTFLDYPIDNAALRRAVKASRFETMREREMTEGIPAHEYDRGDEESRRMRRGKVGGFADYLQPADLAAIEAGCTSGLNPAAKALKTKIEAVLPAD